MMMHPVTVALSAVHLTLHLWITGQMLSWVLGFSHCLTRQPFRCEQLVKGGCTESWCGWPRW